MIRLDPQWPIGRPDPQDERNRMHLVAIREARLDVADQRARIVMPRVAPARPIAFAPAGARSTVDLCVACA